MNPKSAFMIIVLSFLLVGCNLVSLAIPSTATPTQAPTLEFIQLTSVPPVSSLLSTPSALPSSVAQLSNNQSVLIRAAEVIIALKDRDAEALAAIVHPKKGLRFSPYAFVKDTDLVFLPLSVAGAFSDSAVRTWGAYSGSGAPIDLNFEGYYSQFIYDVDFANAPELSLNHRLGESTSMDNSDEFYPNSMVVEFHFPGFDPQYEGMDWRSLRLVFSESDGVWCLIGIIHDQWTT